MLAGDLRLFYILWLTAVERGLLADDQEEPLPGIGPLSAPLKAFAEFFQVDLDLVRAAAESPANPDSGGSFDDESRKAITSIPADEKTDLLLRLVNGDVHIAAELRTKIRVAWDATEGQSRGQAPDGCRDSQTQLGRSRGAQGRGGQAEGSGAAPQGS